MSKRLVLPVGGSSLLKSHVSAYTRKDGAYVAEHDDKRQKKAGNDATYSHPHVVGKSKVIDPHATSHKDSSGIQFAGTEYWSTGKQGKSFHDETPVREFEAEDGHRVWGDDHGRVHADSKDEVPHLRKKFEAHSAAEQGEAAPASGDKDPASGGADASGGEQKVSKADVVAATLGQHNAAAGFISVPPGKGQDKVEEFVNAVKSIGFSLDEGTTYDPNGDSVKLDKNEQGKAVLTNPAGQKVVIMASDGGDRVRISVSLLDAEKKPDKAAGGAGGGSAAPKPAEAAGGADKPSGGEKKPKAEPKAEKVTPAVLKKHSMWSQSDFDYFKAKGYTPEQIKEIWDRDAAAGNKPVEHKKAPGDTAGVAGNPNFYKSLADGVRFLLGRTK